MKNLRRIVSMISIALVIASVIKELRMPPAERTWHGTIAGIFPYDLRIPTPARVRATLWNPDDPRILVPTIFGVGWTLNFGAIAALTSG